MSLILTNSTNKTGEKLNPVHELGVTLNIELHVHGFMEPVKYLIMKNFMKLHDIGVSFTEF